MLAHTADSEVSCLIVAVSQGNGVPCLYTQGLGHLFVHDHALLPQRHRLAGEAFVQVSKLSKLHSLGNHEVDVHLTVGAILPGGFHGNGQRIGDVLLIIKVVVNRAAFGGLLLGNDGHHVVVVNVAVLLGDDGVQRIRDAKARHQQRGAARHADDRHPEALFVAQQVAAGNFPAEGQPPPQRGDAFQQNALAGLGGAGQHKGRRVLLQGGAAGQRRDAHGEQDKGAARKQRLAQPPGGGNRRHIIHQFIGGPDDGREGLEADGQSGYCARCSRREGVDQVLLHDGCARIAQGFQRADLQAFFLDHAGHGGGYYQCRHQEEEYRKDGGNGGELIHIGGKGRIADVFAAVPDVPGGVLHIVQGGFSVLDLRAGIGQGLFGFDLGVLIFYFSVP